MIEDDEEQFREGSDAVLFEKPGICMEFLTFSRDGLREGEKERQKRNSTLWGLGSYWWVGSPVRIILCYYEPSPHHVQAMNASLAWMLNTSECLRTPSRRAILYFPCHRFRFCKSRVYRCLQQSVYSFGNRPLKLRS
jgi:hypothetical protein